MKLIAKPLIITLRVVPLPFLFSACAHTRPAPVNDVAHGVDVCRAETARGFELIQAKKYAEAEPVLKHAIEADSMYGPAHNDLGLVYYRMDRLYEAAWEFENAIKLMPRQPEPRNNLGLDLEKAGKVTEALASFTQASQMDPDNADYLGNLARVRVRLGMRDEETRRVLEALLHREKRPQWVAWARYTLIRLQGAKIEDAATTAPSAVK